MMNEVVNLINNDKRGNIIVEGTFIFPIVIISLIAVLYIIINLFMITCIKAEGDKGVEQCSYQLCGVKEISGDFAEYQLYYRFSDNGKAKNELVSKIEKTLNSVSVYRSPENISVAYSTLSIYPKLKVKIDKNYKLSKLWPSSIDRSENIEYSIHDECEFIRNLDLLSEGVFSSYQDISKKSMEENMIDLGEN